MTSEPALQCRHYASYTGVRLPLNLISPLEAEELARRMTYFRGYYDSDERLVALEKVVYGEIEFEHRYEYDADGRLTSAQLSEPGEEPRQMRFD